jgi:DNA-binding NtrC family response regulator
MPGMNGRELANLLLGKHPAMKVLLMSGYADHELLQGIQGGKWAPVFHYIQKPFSLEGLALKVRKILDRRIKVPQSRDAKSIKLASNNPLPTNVRQAGKR